MIDQENIAACVFHDDRHDDCVQHSGQAPCMTQSESDLLRQIEQIARERDEARADEKQAMAYLQRTREALGHKGDFPSMIEEAKRLKKTDELARKFARSKGRFHSQQAMCELLESYHMPCVRPTKEKRQEPAYHEPTCADLAHLSP